MAYLVCMSGPNQHYIPRFLQRGFGVRRRGKPKEIWEYKKGIPAELREIKHVGAEDFFYSAPSDEKTAELDDKITELETPLARQVNALKEMGSGGAVDPQVAHDILFHLVPRTRHIRSTFSDAFASVIDNAVTLFSDPKTLMRFAGLDQPMLNDRFREELFVKLIEDPRFKALGFPEPLFEKIVFQMAKEGFASGQFPQLDPWLGEMSLMTRHLAPLAREGHNKILNDILGSDFKRPDLNGWTWAVETAPAGGALLPDSIAIAYDKASEPHPLLLAGKNKIEAVVMPLSSGLLLVGRRDPAWALPLDTLNSDLAACSSLVLAPDGAQFGELSEIIGTRVDAAIGELIDTALAQFVVPADPPPEAIDAPDEPSQGEPQELRYMVSFLDCADQETAERIAAPLNVLTTQFSRLMPLGRLDGITVAHDYPSAVAGVDRGRPDIAPATTVAADVGTGIAKCIAVIRDDVVKTHLVLSSNVAYALIHEDEATQLWAIHTVANQLALVALQEVVDTSFPGMLLQTQIDGFKGTLHAAVGGALEAYVAAREVNFIGPYEETAATYAALLSEALQRAKDRIPEVRLAYRYDGDLDPLVGEALGHASHILEFAAKLIGHADPSENKLWREGELAGALRAMGLNNWIETFETDLRRFYDRVGCWESFDEFLAFNRHVERLFWQMGLFPWDKPDGSTHIEVPLEIDGLALLRDVLDGKAPDVQLDEEQRAQLGALMAVAEANPPRPFGVLEDQNPER